MKTAAIWWRVSTDEQREISPDTQIAEALTLAEGEGFQVPPAELEGLLLEHPAVADAAVIGKADVEAGEIPKAFVVRRQGSEISDADLMSFVSEKVATFKQVRVVEFVDSIPKNPSGKILRRMLIEQERARAGTF